MASSSSLNGITVRNGPNTSSCATRILALRAGDQRRLDVVPAAGAGMRRAADRDGGAVLAGDVEIAADLGEVPLVDQRPDFGRGIEGMADLQRLHAGGELFDELVGDAACTSSRLDEVQRSPFSE